MVTYRKALKSDVAASARIRSADWETESYWTIRISRYMEGELHPREALPPRVLYVAVEDHAIVGFIAGHLTRRFGCQGELEWIDVIRERRRQGIASELLRLLAAWFVEQKALRVCVDPGNDIARQFYSRHGAVALNRHWMVWENARDIL